MSLAWRSGIGERRGWGAEGLALVAGIAIVAVGAGLLWSWWWGGVAVGAAGAGWMLGVWSRERAGRGAERLAREALSESGTDRRGEREVSGGGIVKELVRELRRVRNELGQVCRERDALLRSIHGGVLTLDGQQRIVRLDRAAEAILGVREGEARGRLVQEMARHAELNRFVEESLARSGTHEAEIGIKGGERASDMEADESRSGRRLRALSAPLGGAEEGITAGLLIVLIDLTELRRLESLRSDFAANVSHELRTPITNIKGYVETLLDSGFDDRDQAMEFLRTVARNADRLGTIIEDLLTLTRLERAEEEEESFETQWEEVGGIVGQVEAELEGQLRAKSITLIREVPADLGAVMNAALMRLALTNLVGNAIRYSPAERRVWVRARLTQRGAGAGGEGCEVVISVQDEGPGIESEHLARLFERFYRVDKARSRDAGGTGLGLAIVKHIAQLHGGAVEVSSTVGVGSVFSLTLPTGRGEGTGLGALHARP